MPHLKKVILIGHVGRTPKVGKTNNGKDYATFSLAVQDSYDKERTEWFSCTVWGKRAAIVQQYITKGSSIYVEGEIKSRSYTGKDGAERFSMEVNVDDFKFIDLKKAEGESADTSTPFDDDSDLGF